MHCFLFLMSLFNQRTNFNKFGTVEKVLQGTIFLYRFLFKLKKRWRKIGNSKKAVTFYWKLPWSFFQYNINSSFQKPKSQQLYHRPSTENQIKPTLVIMRKHARHTPNVKTALRRALPYVNVKSRVRCAQTKYVQQTCDNIWTRVLWRLLRVKRTWNLKSIKGDYALAEFNIEKFNKN